MEQDRINSNIQELISNNWWFLPVLVSIVTLISEIIDHHHEGTLLRNQEFLREVVIFSVLFPIILGIIVYYLREAFKERDSLTTELDQLLTLSKALSVADDWDDLLLPIGNYLKQFIPLENLYLGAFEPEIENFQVVANWSAESLNTVPQVPDILDITSKLKFSVRDHDSSDPDEVEFISIDFPDKSVECFLVPLSFGAGIFALLILDLFEEGKFSSIQKNTISSILPDITMAVAHVYSTEIDFDQSQSRQIERKRIARILHDTLAQDISYLKLKLELLQAQDSLIGIIEVQRDLERMQKVAQNAFKQVRGTLDSLVSEMPNDVTYAIRNVAESICQPAEIKVNYSSSGSPQMLPDDAKKKIVNIVREAVSNVEKHSGASEVYINIKWCESQFLLEVEDSGCGFSPEECLKTQHYGMIFMHERADSIGADLQIVSCPDEGTKVILALSL